MKKFASRLKIGWEIEKIMSKILIVDDEKIMLMMARRFLSTKYEVVCASSGAEAIKRSPV